MLQSVKNLPCSLGEISSEEIRVFAWLNAAFHVNDIWRKYLVVTAPESFTFDTLSFLEHVGNFPVGLSLAWITDQLLLQCAPLLGDSWRKMFTPEVRRGLALCVACVGPIILEKWLPQGGGWEVVTGYGSDSDILAGVIGGIFYHEIKPKLDAYLGIGSASRLPK